MEKPALRSLSREFSRVSAPASVVALYCALSAITRGVFQGDTPYYIGSILTYAGGRDLAFWDFGHLLWRPAVWALVHAIHPFLSSTNAMFLASAAMAGINWMAGLGSVLLFASLVKRFASVGPTILATAALIMSQAFLNYIHSGTPYIPGLFFLLLGLNLATSRSSRTDWANSLACGLAFAAASLLWLPYIFALPASVLLPVITAGLNRERCLYVLRAGVVAGTMSAVTYGIVALRLGLSSAAEFRLWFDLASHSIDHIRGFPRATFGFVRSWFEMNNYGTELRRFFIHDPYASVRLVSLLSTGMLKILVTYLFLGAIVFKLLRGSPLERRMLFFATLIFVPVFSFGVCWQGGDMERYLGVLPVLLMAGACAMSCRPSPHLRVLGIVFLSALTITNLTRDLRWVRNAEDRELAARLTVLDSVPENSYIVLFPADPLFELIAFKSIDPNSKAKHLTARSVADIGTSHVIEWREIFASNSLAAWEQNRQVWICRGMLDDVPARRWGWIEGIDPLVSWQEISDFFRHLQTSHNRGEFVQLLPTQTNIAVLQQFVPQLNRSDCARRSQAVVGR
jgi:hypothetical protein